MIRKVLLIDDDRMHFAMIAGYFKKFRGETYELDWAGTYGAGLAQLLTGEFAACLLDYQLGDRDGLQLIEEAVAAGCRTPIIFLTADASTAVDTQAMHAGALDYLVKGEITGATLERSVRYALKLGETLEALRRLATHDPLTGLLNRREFERMRQKEEERSRRFQHSVALVMVDIDHFKSVNDRHGHLAGDAVLREVSARLRAVVDNGDAVARFGGEEFVLMLVQADRKAAIAVAERACAAIARQPIAVGEGVLVPITVSAGVAVLPDDGADLIAAADRALYAAKAGGRNRVVGWSERSA